MIGKNNPFNIRYNPLNKWKGLTGNTRGFCDFEDIYFGIRTCMYLILRSYPKKNVLTVSEIINRFAPSSENNTDKYINYVCAKCICFPWDIPSEDFGINELIQFFYAMSCFEGNPTSKINIQVSLKLFFVNGKDYNKVKV